MILEVAAGVLLGNTVSMGLIAGVNMHLDRKHAVKVKERWEQIAKLADQVFDQDAVEKPVKTTAKKRATAAASRTQVP